MRNSSRYFVSRLALNLVMKGHEDGGQCSLEWKKLFLSPKQKALSADILRKEVIQPQVPLRLPCYDFTPVEDPTVVCANKTTKGLCGTSVPQKSWVIIGPMLRAKPIPRV